MADKKISALTAETNPEAADLAHIVTDLSTSATNKKITLTNLFNKIPTTIGYNTCLLYTSPSPRDVEESRMPSSA